MGCMFMRGFKTEEEAVRYADELIFQYGKDRIFIFYEPDEYPDTPYTVNLD